MAKASIRTLFITKLPYPLVGGEHLRSWQNINNLSQFGPVHVFSIFRYHYDESQIPTVETWRSYNVNQQPFIARKLEPFVWWLQKKGLWDYWPFRYSAAKQLDNMLSALKPDLVVFEELWLYPYLSIVERHGCRVVFDHHNVEALLFESTKCRGHGLRGWLRSKVHLPQIRRDEADFMRKADQTWVCSQNDRALLARLYNGGETQANCYVVPNAIAVQNYAGRDGLDGLSQKDASQKDEQWPAFMENAEREHTVLYLGNFGYIPNAEAAEILINQIYPCIKKHCSKARLLMVGREPTAFMQAAAKNDGNITVTGRVINIEPYLASASVMVVPLQKGSGTRFKVLEAFASNCPVVSTAKGVEGLDVEDGKHLLIRDRPIEIARGVIQLWRYHKQAQSLTRAAYQRVQEKYSWEASGYQIQKALSDLL